MRCLNINDAQVVATLGQLGVSVEPRKAVRFRNWHLADMAKEHRDVRSWAINGPSSDASQGSLIIHLRTELSCQQLQVLDDHPNLRPGRHGYSWLRIVPK